MRVRCGPAEALLALGLLRHAATAVLRFPHAPAIVGFADIDVTATTAMPLTSIRQPRQEPGRTAAHLVLDEGTNPDHVHEQATFVPALLARASTPRLALPALSGLQIGP
ncbi:hypothetical protein GCM10010168_37150 [Actinoplanes ianthinogenes]|uniref:Transcriptional regulator LacI/GalR-like sensor domain-containing protein n=1 Tax=Actinoplanes ianthinogenes TaxID=122358 RepID=A0ABM7M556_9ACTN|nr:substrate-binding domain-containing protein [Actinoplanes ianthinogenes]BCJ46763.1 hypothetical protein Aiant_74200 [Actinoplanes ianthinogenes]GGR15755.1 hypothetical protein GCM10010168_37150 [Actinoplanes ianthinogenes]